MYDLKVKRVWGHAIGRDALKDAAVLRCDRRYHRAVKCRTVLIRVTSMLHAMRQLPKVMSVPLIILSTLSDDTSFMIDVHATGVFISEGAG